MNFSYQIDFKLSNNEWKGQMEDIVIAQLQDGYAYGSNNGYEVEQIFLNSVKYEVLG